MYYNGLKIPQYKKKYIHVDFSSSSNVTSIWHNEKKYKCPKAIKSLLCNNYIKE